MCASLIRLRSVTCKREYEWDIVKAAHVKQRNKNIVLFRIRSIVGILLFM